MVEIAHIDVYYILTLSVRFLLILLGVENRDLNLAELFPS